MLKLPNEILLSIVNLSSIPALASLSRCSKNFHKIFSPSLYERDLAGQSVALERSVSRYRGPADVLNVFESILKAGGDLGKEIEPARVAPYFSVPEAFLFDDDHKINAIHIAAYAGLTEVVEYLIKGRHVALGTFTHSPLHYALQGRCIKTSKTLIQQGADLCDKITSALDVAALQGLTEIVVLLVDKKGMDPDGQHTGWNPLSCAILNGGAGYKDDALATVTFLLQRGANPDLPVYSCELSRENWPAAFAAWSEPGTWIDSTSRSGIASITAMLPP
ncbi:hypothetical protein FLAG1_11173 [Fusarium langsethiae]|uniref:F-box domain-containing protein n=1 Tax=Fusarium langsethiae TaxID=179993 RepID=A0A0M9EN23_FUSLA|nr:hypothetical protein FLAG1_11173 [Fusarium langsethiae]GKU22685.1 unnamed protein product [Fusarium langsethiae]